ncbi:NAD-dependent epimerase/dehydratase family protein [Agarivorans sp. 1_MG-2023]|uniref:NAD-dependent epimerase/dehydratase family protein n=1 Tax=Agarivorans sp. 1_MG-2023 TaxID=3062634 RepID=UPI0026E2CB39|nr:NAD-dependent epimerase/dehydratase family protein [Agarivorans sp. 1_MG-2023]MDO6762044.1 NAD-dependent epimerase/dehydratase family protein [Agarivorans sp. 1_MG-2023]
MKRVLVTGGAGFIGANLIRALGTDVELTVIDNLQSGTKQNLVGLDIKLIVADICSFDFSSLPKQDEIYHLACVASPQHYQAQPLATLASCFLGTQRLLDFALKNNSKVVFTSTSEVYGDPLEFPQAETYHGNVNPLSKRACYDEGKRVAETLCYEYYVLGLDVKIARVFNTFGPYMSANDGRVIANFINQAIQGQALTIYGDGMQTRSLVYVDDTVTALQRLMALVTQQLCVVNVGNDQEKTILQLALDVKSAINPQLPFAFQALPEADPQRRRPCLAKSNALLGKYQFTSWQQGLNNTIKYFSSPFASLLSG